jgi:regulator of ribosome biosynthesis
MTRTSTASMGKFDRVLDGEKKLRGVKRKVPYRPTFLLLRCSFLLPQFDPIEKSVDAERSSNMALLKQIGNGNSSAKRAKRDAAKAVRLASRGQGAAALARKSDSGSGQERKVGKD